MTAPNDAVLHLAVLPNGGAAPPRRVAELLDLAARAGLRTEELKVEGDLVGTRVWRIRRKDQPRRAEVLLVHWHATGAGRGEKSEHLLVYAHNPKTGQQREVRVAVLRYTMRNIADGRMHSI